MKTAGWSWCGKNCQQATLDLGWRTGGRCWRFQREYVFAFLVIWSEFQPQWCDWLVTELWECLCLHSGNESLMTRPRAAHAFFRLMVKMTHVFATHSQKKLVRILDLKTKGMNCRALIVYGETSSFSTRKPLSLFSILVRREMWWMGRCARVITWWMEVGSTCRYPQLRKSKSKIWEMATANKTFSSNFLE